MNIKAKLAVAAMLAVFVVPGISFAQTASVGSTASLQAEISALLAEVQQLEAQLTAQGGSTVNWCANFNTNLSIGMSGSAVTALQTALQKDGESVTLNGTFDDQTAAAVTGFQEKYASQILTPNGLTNGTGYAGVSTRTELNSLFGCHGIVPPPIVPPVTVPTPTPTQPQPTPTSVPTIQSISPTSASVGTSVIIQGANFGATNTVLFNGLVAASNVSSNGASLAFTVPSSLSPNCQSGEACPDFMELLTSGTYSVSVLNVNGTSNALSLAVTAASTPTPVVTQTSNPSVSLSPSSVTSGNTATLSWSGTKSGDDLIISCPTGVSVYDVGNNQNFPCGDAQRYVASSGSYTLRFTNTNTTPTTATVQISYNQGTNTNAEAWANVTINPSATLTPTAAATASPTSLSFTLAQGSNSQSQIITLNNLPLSVQIQWTCSLASCAWVTLNDTPSNFLSYNNSTGVLSGSEIVTANSANLSPGTYSGSIIYSGNSNGLPMTIPVTLTVTASASTSFVSPTFQITSPNGGETWQAGTMQQVTWTSTGYPASSPVEVLVYDTRYGASDDVLDLPEMMTTVGAGSYSIAVPASAPAGSNYKVELQVVTSPLGTPMSISNAPFTITAAPATPTAPTVSITSDPSTIPAGTMQTGASGSPVFTFYLWNSSNENVSITNLPVDLTVSPSSSHAPFSNVTLADVTTPTGVYQAPAFTSIGTGLYATTFHFSTPLVLPANSHHLYSVAVSIPAYVADTSLPGVSGTLSVPASGLTAIGATSNLQAIVSGSAAASAMTVVRGN